MKILPLVLLISAWVPFAEAGDYFPFYPKRLTFEFAPPFDDPAAPKIPPAKLTITLQKDDEGHPRGVMKSAKLALIEVELGKERLVVPKELLDDMGELDLQSLDFFWVGYRYFVALSRPVKTAGERPERIEFVFDKGSLVNVSADHKSLRDNYPKIFKPEAPAETAPAEKK